VRPSLGKRAAAAVEWRRAPPSCILEAYEDFAALSAVLLVCSACDGGGGASSGPPQPVLSVNGSISAAGRNVVPAYGVAGFNKSGTAGVIVSDAATGCDALTAEYTSRHMPAAGTYVAVALGAFDVGVADDSFVYFTVITAQGTDMSGGGSNAGTVEILDATDAAVTIRVDHHDSLSDGDYAMTGDFSVTRCPSP
jgi:hypothetical protein